ncbi:MAG: enoyl-CoA hydratase/isomerase family protein [Bacteroidota bacterium]|jgi:enoyl-CoA hydratase
MDYQNILTEVDGGIQTITINRPDKLNALNRQTIQEIGAAMRAAESNPAVQVIILTGSGSKAFVAGADISEFSSYTQEQGMDLAQKGHDVFNSIEQLGKPVIAAVNGFALGGGCELAMACHIRVASDNAKFGQPEVKLGLIPGYGGTQRLVHLIGKTKATELLMTADMIGSEEALQLGLVNHVVSQDQLMSKCREIAEKIIKQAPLAIASIIRCVNASHGPDGFSKEVNEFGKCFITEDFKEGAGAFLEKRAPSFKGK